MMLKTLGVLGLAVTAAEVCLLLLSTAVSLQSHAQPWLQWKSYEGKETTERAQEVLLDVGSPLPEASAPSHPGEVKSPQRNWI